MSLKELQAVKREWLKNTITYDALRKFYKLNAKDISLIKSEVKYHKERFNLKDVREYLDRKIMDNLHPQKSILWVENINTKVCESCKKDVNVDYFTSFDPNICMVCEKEKELKCKNKLAKIKESRMIRASSNQIPML